MYPFGDLPGNLAAFCGVLRRDYGFRLGPGEINDAARVLQRIDLTDQQHVRDAWRTILSSSRETAIAFDRGLRRVLLSRAFGLAAGAAAARRSATASEGDADDQRRTAARGAGATRRR